MIKKLSTQKTCEEIQIILVIFFSYLKFLEKDDIWIKERENSFTIYEHMSNHLKGGTKEEWWGEGWRKIRGHCKRHGGVLKFKELSVKRRGASRNSKKREVQRHQLYKHAIIPKQYEGKKEHFIICMLGLEHRKEKRYI